MTIDEAITHCKEQVQEQAKKGCYSCAEEHQQLAEWLKELKAYRNKSEIPTSCGDAVSRKAVFEQIAEWIISGEYGFTNATDYLSKKIKALPSVTPQQRIGEWIEHFDEIGKWYECDQCHTDWGGPVNYCPNCGAKMEVEE